MDFSELSAIHARSGLVESPVLSNGHAGFGGRPEETDRSKNQHRASGRPNRAEGKKHNAALICLARRRIDVLHAMLRTRTPYQHKPAESLALAA